MLAVLATVLARQGAGEAGFCGSDRALPTALAALEGALDWYGKFLGGLGGFENSNGSASKGSAAEGSRRTITRALRALFVANLLAMGLGAVVSYRNAPLIPEAICGPDGETVVTDEAVRAGKKVLQSAGLMNQGSILGNGAYFGVDLTADALALKTDAMRDFYARECGAEAFDALDDDGQAAVAARVERELDATSGPEAEYSPAEAHAHQRVREEYIGRYYEGENDWPYAPASGNRPPTRSMIWSAISVILLVGGRIGV